MFVLLSLLLPVLSVSPLFVAFALHDETVPDVSVEVKAGCAQDDVLTYSTFVHVLALLDFGKFAPLAVVVVGYSHLLGRLLVLLLALLLAQLHNKPIIFIVVVIAAQRTGDFRIGPGLMLRPLFEAAEVKAIPTHLAAGGDGIEPDNLLLADGT